MKEKCVEESSEGGGAYPHTLQTKGEKQCNLHVNGGKISQKIYHTQAYECMCG